MSWYKVTISYEQQGKIQDEFAKLFFGLRGPKEMALFSGGLSQSATLNIYFTPACASQPVMKGLMDNWGAVPCEEPTRETESELCYSCGADPTWGKHTWAPDK